MELIFFSGYDHEIQNYVVGRNREGKEPSHFSHFLYYQMSTIPYFTNLPPVDLIGKRGEDVWTQGLVL